VATKIKMQRIGAKKNPFYRIIIAESDTARDGGAIDYVGTYNPHKDPPEIILDQTKLSDWLSKGALPTPKVNALIRQAKKRLAVEAQ
jgi:small subunit ribosomal protein S16